MNKQLSQKLESVKGIIKNLHSCVLAYSGGVDSTLLLKLLSDVLPKNKFLAVTANSETYSRDELNFARSFTRNLKVKHLIVNSNELKSKNFLKNTTQRCFYCKNELFSQIEKIAKKYKLRNIVYGANFDDKFDFRPGHKAAEAFGVRAPLVETKLGKNEIYRLSKYFNLPTKDKPSLACLASRFPYGEEITTEKLRKVDKIESLVRSLAIPQVRSRHHNDICRIEVESKNLSKLLKERLKVTKLAKSLGYKYVSLDLEGYRTGSLNEVIKNA